MKRPTGFTILSLLLGWLALAGFANCIIQFNMTRSISTALFAFCYGLSALASAVGLWKFRPWAFKAVTLWVIVVALLALNMQFGMQGMYTSPLPLFAAFMAFTSILLGLLLFYVKKKLAKAV